MGEGKVASFMNVVCFSRNLPPTHTHTTLGKQRQEEPDLEFGLSNPGL